MFIFICFENAVSLFVEHICLFENIHCFENIVLQKDNVNVFEQRSSLDYIPDNKTGNLSWYVRLYMSTFNQ